MRARSRCTSRRRSTFGPTIVYDAERCIVCTRCIRVCNELARDPVLAVRERGNLEEITRLAGRASSTTPTRSMTEHVCPVGALTSTRLPVQGAGLVPPQRPDACATAARRAATPTSTTIRATTRRTGTVPRENTDGQHVLDVRRGHALVPATRSRGGCSRRSSANDDASLEDALAAAKAQLGEPRRRPVEGRVRPVGASTRTRTTSRSTTSPRRTSARPDFFVSGKPLGEGDDILISEDKNPNTRGAVQIAAATSPRPVAELLQGIASRAATRTWSPSGRTSRSTRARRSGRSRG